MSLSKEAYQTIVDYSEKIEKQKAEIERLREEWDGHIAIGQALVDDVNLLQARLAKSIEPSEWQREVLVAVLEHHRFAYYDEEAYAVLLAKVKGEQADETNT